MTFKRYIQLNYVYSFSSTGSRVPVRPKWKDESLQHMSSLIRMVVDIKRIEADVVCDEQFRPGDIIAVAAVNVKFGLVVGLVDETLTVLIG